MDASDFNTVVMDQLQRSLDMLTSKNAAYNPNEDKLHIFKRIAILRGTTPQSALSGMMAKHTGSIYDMCESGEEYSIEVWNEKITDHINYLLLLRAVVDEQQADRDEQLRETDRSFGPGELFNFSGLITEKQFVKRCREFKIFPPNIPKAVEYAKTTGMIKY